MQLAIRQAKIGQRNGDYAIGALIIKGDKVITAHNSRSKRDESPIAHAEVLAILRASEILGKRHLANCVLYSTHEPCPMCAFAAVFAKLKGIVYGARIEDMKRHREKNGNGNYLWRTIEISCKEVIEKSTENILLVKDFMREECLKLFHA